MELIAVAAIAENGVIGDGPELPWPSIPEDRRQYRERIADDPVILGRRTFEMMRDDLPGAAQVVLSRSERSFEEESAHHAGSVGDAVDVVEGLGADRAFVIGGEQIYDLFLPHVDRMVLSRVEGEYEGDAHFPDWDPDDWALREETRHERFVLQQWERDD